jgi:predicted anti-sigma-YlaC factor YlaD
MEIHLDPSQVERCRNHQLTPDEMPAVYQHLGVCEACRARVESPEDTPFMNLRTGIWLDTARDEGHLTEAQKLGYAANTLGQIDRQIVETHLEYCAECVEALQRFRAFRILVSTYPHSELEPLAPLTLRDRLNAWSRSRPIRFTLQTFVPACAIILLFVLLRPRWFGARPTAGDDLKRQLALAQRDLQAEVSKRQAAEVEANRLTVEQKRLTLLAQAETKTKEELTRKMANLRGQLHTGMASTIVSIGKGLYRDNGQLLYGKPIQPNDAPWVIAAVTRGEVRSPLEVEQWNQSKAMQGGDPTQSPTIKLQSPVNTFILTNRPQFRWKPVQPGRYYRLNLLSEGREPVATILLNSLPNGQQEVKVYGIDPSHVLDNYTTKAGNEWELAAGDKLSPLQPGETYQWSVQELNRPGVDAAPADETAIIGTSSPRSARFQITDSVTRAQVQRAESLYTGNHLLLGAYFAKLGLIEEARKEFALEPDRKAIAPLLKRLPQAP